MNIKPLQLLMCFFVLTTIGANCQLMERPGSHSVIHNMDEDRQSYMPLFDGHPSMLAQFKKSKEYKQFMAAKTDREPRSSLNHFLSLPSEQTHVYYDTAKQKKRGKG